MGCYFYDPPEVTEVPRCDFLETEARGCDFLETEVMGCHFLETDVPL